MSGVPFAPLVEVTRNGVVESVHHGLVVICDAEGRVLEAHGDPGAEIVTRSTAKPFQAAQAVASGLADAAGVRDVELAVATGSHGGAPEHVAIVRDLLTRLELDADDLRCGVHLPFDRSARAVARTSGADVLQNNCSGKHALMLAGARETGRPPGRYLEPSEPWQRAVREIVASAAGLEAEGVGVVTDGCGAPSFVLPAVRFARAWALLASSSEAALDRVWRAAVAHPRMIGGAGRLETALMETRPGSLLAKSGAEGVWAIAHAGPDGPRGALIKIADGDDRRARTAVAIEVAARLAEFDDDERAALVSAFLPPVTTLTGDVVGTVAARLD